MNWLKNIFLILLAFFLTVLDTVFFSVMPVGGATLLSVFEVAIVFSLIGKIDDFLVFTIFAAIFLSIFSSLPVWVIFLTFLVFNGSVFFFRKNYLPEVSIWLSIVFFVVINTIFELILILVFSEWNKTGLGVAYYFVLINSILGVIVYHLVKTLNKNLQGETIKIK